MVCCCLILAAGFTDAAAAPEKLKVMASTFPVHQITRNLVAGSHTVETALLIPAQLGCPHDYVLTPQDLRQLAGTDVLIINGLGMEEFLESLLEKAGRNLKIIDSSAGITETLPYKNAEHGYGTDETGHSEALDSDKQHAYSHHKSGGVNPHLFASPRMAARLAINIAEALCEIDPGGTTLYTTNARAYADKMNQLAENFAALGKKLVNNRIVTQHGVFDYLARDMGLQIVAAVQPHAGQEPSAAEMLELVETIKRERAGAVFTEPQYPANISRTIARETGIAFATLDPAANGPNHAPLDYYETIMRQNITALGNTLGIR